MGFEFDIFSGEPSDYIIIGLLVLIGSISVFILLFGYQKVIVMLARHSEHMESINDKNTALLTQCSADLKEHTNNQTDTLLAQQSLEKMRLEGLLTDITRQNSVDFREQTKDQTNVLLNQQAVDIGKLEHLFTTMTRQHSADLKEQTNDQTNALLKQ